ncbi:glycosyltransferase family 2 protein [bacterium]|nr:glycosyltransferase family 2 protein [bacterium]
MAKPKISVVIPAFNAQDTVASTLFSVFWQTFRDLEVIVVDDGSTDNTEAVVKECASFSPFPFCYLRQSNKGPASARNHGFREAKGEYLIWLDADDIWLPDRLRLLFYELKKKKADLCTSDAYLWLPPAQILGTYYQRYPLPSKLSFEELLKRNFVFTSTLMRREVWEKVGGLCEEREIIGVEDYEFWLRVIKAGFKLQILKEPLMLYRLNPEGLSAKEEKISLALLRVFALAEKLNLSDKEKEILSQRKKALFFHLASLALKEGNQKKLREWLKEAQKEGANPLRIWLWLIWQKFKQRK